MIIYILILVLMTLYLRNKRKLLIITTTDLFTTNMYEDAIMPYYVIPNYYIAHRVKTLYRFFVVIIRILL